MYTLHQKMHDRYHEMYVLVKDRRCLYCRLTYKDIAFTISSLNINLGWKADGTVGKLIAEFSDLHELKTNYPEILL